MAYDGTLKFDTSIDGGGFKNGITKIASLAKTGLKTAVTAITAVTGALSAGAAVGVKYNAQMEQYITSFGTMLGSAEKATALVNDLKEMGAKTPFETSDLAKGSQTLLAFGTAADDLLPTLQMLGDVSQGNKERFDSLTLAFAQVSSAGKLTGQDLLQFVNAGFNPLNEICKKTGESMAEARDRMSEGGVSAEEVAAAFKSAASEGGQFYQAMEAQSQTFNGQLSTLKDNVMSFIGDLTQGVTGTLKNTVLPMVNGWLGELQEAFKSGGVEGVVSALGGVLADACTQLAQAAPGVVDLAVGFIQSFIQGIAKNKDKLLTAAKNIVSALVNGLVKLLPKEVQKPVKETIDILKKSFQDGGLRTAINTVSNILKNLGKVVTNLAKALLPPLAKAVDFLADNLDILLPLVTGIVAALKTMSIVKSITTWITGLKAAMGLATVATQGATTAQLALNGAMSANPIGLVIGAVSGLITILATLWATTDQATESTDRLRDANQTIADSYETVSEKALEFQQGIETAESYLSGFNDTMFTSAESQQALEDEMQRIQDGITTICKLASEERRGYTVEEIQQLEEYFQKLHDLQEQQLEAESLIAEAITQQGVTAAQAFSGSLAEYEAEAQRWIATAREQADKQTQIIEEQTINEVALLNKRYGTQATLANDAYKKEYDEIVARKEERLALVNEEVGKVAGAWEQGYLDQAEDLASYLTHVSELQEQEIEENRRYSEQKLALEEEYNQTLGMKALDAAARQRGIKDRMREAEEEHNKKIGDIQAKYVEGLDEEVKAQAGAWFSLINETEKGGRQIELTHKDYVKKYLAAYDKLPDNMKNAGKEAMSGMLKGFSDKAPELFAKASSIAGGVINMLKNKFGIASPSKVTRRMFRQVVEGGEIGVEDEAPSLYKQADKTATGFLKRFSPKLDISAMVAKMKAAVVAQHSAIAPAAEASAFALTQASQISTNASQDGGGGAYVAEVRVDLEGREIARATAPFMGSQLAFSGGL